METEKKVLIECKQASLLSWADHKEWMLDQIEHEFISFGDKTRFVIAVRHADSQIQALHNEITELEAQAA